MKFDLNDNSKKLIFFDIDEVLVHLLPDFCNFWNEYHGLVGNDRLLFENLNSADITTHTNHDSKYVISIFQKYIKNGAYTNLIPIAHAQNCINDLSEYFRIQCLTSRLMDTYGDTENYIRLHFPSVEKVLFATKYYHGYGPTKPELIKINNGLFIVEDSERYALECANEGIPVYLKNYKWNRHIEHELIKKFNCNSDLLEMVLKDFKK